MLFYTLKNPHSFVFIDDQISFRISIFIFESFLDSFEFAKSFKSTSHYRRCSQLNSGVFFYDFSCFLESFPCSACFPSSSVIGNELGGSTRTNTGFSEFSERLHLCITGLNSRFCFTFETFHFS